VLALASRSVSGGAHQPRKRKQPPLDGNNETSGEIEVTFILNYIVPSSNDEYSCIHENPTICRDGCKHRPIRMDLLPNANECVGQISFLLTVLVIILV
jgi:hypothetical protein